jgi:hypothetical protein
MFPPGGEGVRRQRGRGDSAGRVHETRSQPHRQSLDRAVDARPVPAQKERGGDRQQHRGTDEDVQPRDVDVPHGEGAEQGPDDDQRHEPGESTPVDVGSHRRQHEE